MKYAPALFGLAALLAWEAAVRITGVPSYLVPGPSAIIAAFLADPAGLLFSLGSTLLVTFAALLVAASLGVVLAVAIASSRLLAAAIQPWAVVLQVTPIVAIAPLIIVWVGDPFASLVVCATIVAFFPVFANTAAGLASAPAELADLFRLYGAGRLATLWLLRLPAAVPYFLAGLRISGGLGPGRRGGGGVRRGLRRVRVGAGLSHSGSGLPAAGAAHVRGTGVAVACRHRHQLRTWGVRRRCIAATRRRLRLRSPGTCVMGEPPFRRHQLGILHLGPEGEQVRRPASTSRRRLCGEFSLRPRPCVK